MTILMGPIIIIALNICHFGASAQSSRQLVKLVMEFNAINVTFEVAIKFLLAVSVFVSAVLVLLASMIVMADILESENRERQMSAPTT